MILDDLDLGEYLDVMYAWYVNLLGREQAEELLNAPLPGTPEEQAAKDAAFNAGLQGIYQEMGVPWPEGA